jgi:hypothetical protein
LLPPVSHSPLLGLGNLLSGGGQHRTAFLMELYLLLTVLCLFPMPAPVERLTWIVRTIVLPSSIMVTILYWTLVFPSFMTTDVRAQSHRRVSASSLL